MAVIVGLSMMRRSELRPPPVVARAKGQLRAGLRYVRSVPDLWIPLDDDGGRRHPHLQLPGRVPALRLHPFTASDGTFTLLSPCLASGRWSARWPRPARRRSRRVTWCRRPSASGRDARSRGGAASAAFPIGVFVGLDSIAFITASTAIVQMQADPADAGPGARTAGDGLHRQHPDRRTVARIRLRPLRPPGGIGPRCGRRPRGGGVGAVRRPAGHGHRQAAVPDQAGVQPALLAPAGSRPSSVAVS